MLQNVSNRKWQRAAARSLARWILALGVLGSVVALQATTNSQVLAHEDKNPFPNFKSGHVTGVPGGEGKAIQIDDINYPILQSAVLTDQYENPVTVKDLAQGERVLFHLDSKGRIDRMVLWIPS